MMEHGNHKRRPRPVTEEQLTLFSSADVKRHIRLDCLRSKADDWGQLLKSTLGVLITPEEETRYHQTMDEVLLEIVNQLIEPLNKTDKPDAALARIDSGAFATLFDEILSR